MSKNITIQEGGTGVQLTVDKLKTGLVGGGTCMWVPEDEVQLTTKSIDKDGTYRASTEGYYGYSEVTVRGVGQVTGKDNDGDEATATVNDDGEIEITKIPSYIQVVTPPTYTGPYGDRAYISFEGMVVKAFLESGNAWTDEDHPNGIIPSNELIFPTTVTDISKVVTERETEYDGSLPSGNYPRTIYSARSISSATYMYTVIGDGYLAFRVQRAVRDEEEIYVVYGSVFCSSDPNTTLEKVDKQGRKRTYRLDDEITREGKTAYYYWGFADTWYDYWSVGSLPPGTNFSPQENGVSAGGAAWIILYGTQLQNEGVQTIDVLWDRPGDGKELQSSFDVTVVDITPGGQGED